MPTRPIKSISAWLVSRGLGVTAAPAPTIYEGGDANLPQLPANLVLVTIAELGGDRPVKVHNRGAKGIRGPAFQITARHLNGGRAADHAEAMWNACGGDTGLANIQIGDWFFLWMRTGSDPFGLPSDANGRARVAFNLETAVRL